MIKVSKHFGPVGLALSGGLDSTILLHHLVDAGNEVHAYTMLWGEDHTEAEASLKLAIHYGVKHTIIPFTYKEYWESLEDCMTYFDRPRYNVWPDMILKQANLDLISNFYIGEGCDEIFGYSDRSYFQGWTDLLCYHLPTWQQCADHYHMDLFTPFLDLETSLKEKGKAPSVHFPYMPDKEYLWEVYKDYLPTELILYPKRSQMKGMSYYTLLNLTKTNLLRKAAIFWLEAQG